MLGCCFVMALIRLQERFDKGVFLSRLNRFMVEMEVHGKTALAHLPNSGRLLTVLVPNAEAYLVRRQRIGSKSSYDMFAVQSSHVPIIVDTRFSSVATRTSVQKGLVKSLKGYRVVKENVEVNSSLLDLLLQRGRQKFFLEIKCVTHVVDKVALFPDAPTKRGRKHVNTLMRLVEQGYDAGILFSVQRPDAEKIRPYREMDPLFEQLLRKTVEKGVKVFTEMLVFKPSGMVELKTDFPPFSFT
ncbi:MAG: DNA/RNA nuclease SfsA, partial [Candidatus Bathyarchaeota archaeon]|nr:DNA/RNA nuclease SfsA [Candidatus Bathyarchaeota archaeon]